MIDLKRMKNVVIQYQCFEEKFMLTRTFALSFSLIVTLFLSACSQTYINQQPIGKVFPNVEGEGLDERVHQLPDYFSDKTTVLLLGYKQESQFDIDRWLIGLDMTGTQADVYELPTIQGWLPRQIKGVINEGMRKGIPEELWSIVITVYEDGETLQAFTGNEKPINARVIVLDKTGKVQFFHDRGFSVGSLKELNAQVKKLQK